MTAAHFSVLLAETPTADEVKPGWTALLLVFLMGVALFFLMRSMIKQFRKIDIPDDEQSGDDRHGDGRPVDGESDDAADPEQSGGTQEHETNGSAT